jgi:hypothetical protein
MNVGDHGTPGKRVRGSARRLSLFPIMSGLEKI